MPGSTPTTCSTRTVVPTTSRRSGTSSTGPTWQEGSPRREPARPAFDDCGPYAGPQTPNARCIDSCSRILDGPLALGDGGLVAPREVDPQVGALPHVVALHDRVALLVEHGRAHLGHLALAELLHAAQRVSGVGDVVGDEDAGVADIDEIGRRRQDARHLEAFVD